jgi:hypothetical protein
MAFCPQLAFRNGELPGKWKLYETRLGVRLPEFGRLADKLKLVPDTQPQRS